MLEQIILCLVVLIGCFSYACEPNENNKVKYKGLYD